MFRSQNDMLSNEFIDLVKRFAYIAEIKEWDNRQHLDRIRLYSFLLATGLDLPKMIVEQISIACILHDIGKVVTPAELLLRQGKFSKFEWQTMEHHTIDGALILSGSNDPFMITAASCVNYHHEKWDGSGYPQGLSGQGIPLEARICAIADVFDALTTYRIYKSPMDDEEAFELIINSSGKHFDPELVHVFRSSFPEILKIKKLNSK